MAVFVCRSSATAWARKYTFFRKRNKRYKRTIHERLHFIENQILPLARSHLHFRYSLLIYQSLSAQAEQEQSTAIIFLRIVSIQYSVSVCVFQ